MHFDTCMKESSPQVEEKDFGAEKRPTISTSKGYMDSMARFCPLCGARFSELMKLRRYRKRNNLVKQAMTSTNFPRVNMVSQQIPQGMGEIASCHGPHD